MKTQPLYSRISKELTTSRLLTIFQVSALMEKTPSILQVDLNNEKALIQQIMQCFQAPVLWPKLYAAM